ncbi:UV-endonuclease UvdE-domain-containing protein [Flagelloscypha sp. PMI_526]|nr:UV-endonuclease UvdE-domain-containing protein [Flagelloscypha sp. PMI_526]
MEAHLLGGRMRLLHTLLSPSISRSVMSSAQLLRRSARALGQVVSTSMPKRKREQNPDVATPPAEQAPEEEEEEAPVRKKRKGKATIQAVKDMDSPIPKAKVPRKRLPKPEPVYVIPDVERRTTTFKGRLGYACINTILRSKKPKEEAIFCSRTCRIDTIKKNGIDFVKDLGRKNVEDLAKLIEWNEENNIKFMRVSSDLFPFASHHTYGYTLDYCSDLLASVGALAKKYGHRLTTHPGQYCQLGSPRPNVTESSIKELEYHAQMMDLLGLDQDGVMILHGGGTYEDKEGTLKRIKHTIENSLSPSARARLVLENDELCYNAEDLLPICEDLDVPLVFDYHHDALNPSSIPPKTIIERANAIFAKRGIKPKQHLSEPRPGAVTLMERRAHADRCQTLPIDLPDDMDLMIEAKDKEQAVLHLYRIYNLQPVKHAKQETKETKGRKSTASKRKNKKAEVVDEDELSQEGGGEGEDAFEEGLMEE